MNVYKLLEILAPTFGAIISTVLLYTFSNLRKSLDGLKDEVKNNTDRMRDGQTSSAVHYSEATNAYTNLASETKRVHDHIDEESAEIKAHITSQTDRVLDLFRK